MQFVSISIAISLQVGQVAHLTLVIIVLLAAHTNKIPRIAANGVGVLCLPVSCLFLLCHPQLVMSAKSYGQIEGHTGARFLKHSLSHSLTS